MNVFVIILALFAIVGFLDKAVGGRFGFEKDVDMGLSTMGTVSIYIVGIYCVGTTFIESNAEAISQVTGALPLDPSIIIGCILAPDLGGFPIALGIAGDKTMGYFSGVVIGGCLGQFISFQLPVIFSMLDSYTKQKMIRGFIYGIVAVPMGLFAGGLVMGIDILSLLLNISIITAVCILLMLGFLRWPAKTEKVLLAFSGAIKFICQILFVLVVISLFFDEFEIVPKETVLDALFLILKMVIIICGGLVFTRIIVKFMGGILKKIASAMRTDTISVVGLLLNMINTLTIVSMLKDMDDNGKILNGAFSVSGSYILGGQLAFILLVAPSFAVYGYIVSKLTAAIIGIIIAVVISKRKAQNKDSGVSTEGD